MSCTYLINTRNIFKYQSITRNSPGGICTAKGRTIRFFPNRLFTIRLSTIRLFTIQLFAIRLASLQSWLPRCSTTELSENRLPQIWLFFITLRVTTLLLLRFPLLWLSSNRLPLTRVSNIRLPLNRVAFSVWFLMPQFLSLCLSCLLSPCCVCMYMTSQLRHTPKYDYVTTTSYIRILWWRHIGTWTVKSVNVGGG